MKETKELPNDANDAVLRALNGVKRVLDMLPIAGADNRRLVVSADDALVSVINALTSGKLKVVEISEAETEEQ